MLRSCKISELHPFHRFIALIDFDQHANAQRATIKKLSNEIVVSRRDMSELLEQHERVKRSVVQARKLVHDVELEMQTLNAQEKSKKARLDTLANYKEYQSLQKEITLLQHMQHELEDSLLQAWNKLETAERELTNKQHEYDEKVIQQQQCITDKEQQVKALEQALATQEQERRQKEEDVPAEWLEKYNIMRTQVSDPVVEVQNKSCSACYQPLSDQEMMRLKRGALMQCKICYRFLYIKEVMDRNLTN